MSGLERIIWHWSAGSYTFSDIDSEHYHFAIDGDGNVHPGDYLPEANISTSDADGYAAHVSKFNTGSIGIAVCAMAEATQSPFNPGKYPIKQIQMDTLYAKTAELCEKYDIPISRETVLNHGEVQITCGVAQSGKWDISWFPDMEKPGDPIAVGDIMREHTQKIRDSWRAPVPELSLEQRVAALEAWAFSFAY